MDINEIKARIRDAHRPERTVPVCLASDLVAEWERLERLRVAALRVASDSLDGGPALQYAHQQDALRGQMEAATIEVLLRAMPRAEHTRMMATHPPRRDEDGQLVLTDLTGYNAETYFPALIRASWVEPALDPDTLTELLDVTLSQGQFDELCTAALVVNRGKVNLPNLLVASTTTPNSGIE